MSRKLATHKKHPGDALVFSYRHLPYGKYSIMQVGVFLLLAGAVVIYYQRFSPWQGGFISHPSAWLPIAGFLVIFLPFALYNPVRDYLIIKNERIEIHSERLLFFTALGRKKFDARLSDIKLIRAGLPITSRNKRYVFGANGKSFFFSAEISDIDRLLRLLGAPK